MDINDVKNLLPDPMKTEPIVLLDETDDFFIFKLDKDDSGFDSVHMVNKHTSKVQSFNPILIKRGEKLNNEN